MIAEKLDNPGFPCGEVGRKNGKTTTGRNLVHMLVTEEG